MYNNQLYNKIISDVSLVVKRTINEAFDFDSIEIDNNVHNRIINDFNKRILLVIDGILTGRIKNITDADPSIIEYINNAVAIYKVYNKKDLKTLIKLCIKIFGNNCNLNWIDTSELTNMDSIFSSSNFDGDISKWNVSNVTSMKEMFWGSKFDGDISQWDVSKVKNMSSMFLGAEFNCDISQWNVSNVKNMSRMFAGSEFVCDISKWDVSKVTDMSAMFYNSIFNGDISKWNVSNVKDMSRMFKGFSSILQNRFNGNLSKWDVSKVKDYSDMFRDCTIKEKYKPHFK